MEVLLAARYGAAPTRIGGDRSTPRKDPHREDPGKTLYCGPGDGNGAGSGLEQVDTDGAHFLARLPLTTPAPAILYNTETVN